MDEWINGHLDWIFWVSDQKQWVFKKKEKLISQQSEYIENMWAISNVQSFFYVAQIDPFQSFMSGRST